MQHSHSQPASGGHERPVHVQHLEAVGLLTLHRAAKANAYDSQLLTSLEEGLAELYSSPQVRAIVLNASGRHFCAGADLHELGTRSPLQALDLQSRRVFTTIARGPKPVIAAIQGAALGGGLELALACDFRIAADTCRLGLPEVALGLVPAAGGLHRLAHLVGASRAREVVLLGRELGAAEALSWGLVNQVVPTASLLDQALELARNLAQRDPEAVRLARLALESSGERDDHALHLEGPMQALLYHRRQSTGSGNGSPR